MELAFSYKFESAHRFISGATKCTTPHGHTWWATLYFRAWAEDLNDSDMSAEFLELKAPWKKFIDDTVDHSFFCNFKDPLKPQFEALIPGFRGLVTPGEPTTEMICGLFLWKALRIYQNSSLEPVRIEVKETPANAVHFNEADLAGFRKRLREKFGESLQGWWDDPAPESRIFEIKKSSKSLMTA